MENNHPALRDDAEASITPLQIVMLVLSIYVLISLAIETIFELPEETEILLGYIDTAVCCVPV